MTQPKLSTFQNAEGAEKFGGNPLFSWPGTLFVIYIFTAIYIVFDEKGRLGSNEDLMWAIGGPIFVYVVSGFQLNYFIVSDTQLIIKNYLFFWHTRIFEKKDISSISFGRPNRSSLSLRVYIGDSPMKSYGAGSLSRKTWNGLKERLTRDGIPIDIN